jgi:hypothetical protein
MKKVGMKKVAGTVFAFLGTALGAKRAFQA